MRQNLIFNILNKKYISVSSTALTHSHHTMKWPIKACSHKFS